MRAALTVAPVMVNTTEAAVRASQKEEQPPPGPAPVEVLDLRSHTALVKLTHDRRVSYQQICREGDTWRVRHALSRSAPTETTGEIAESDRTALEQAANDYVEGFYRAAPERIDRSVDRVMLKFGYWREEGTESWQPLMHDFNGLREMAATWNSKGWLPDDAPREVEVLDVMGKLAAVRLTAWWGVDTLLCVRQDDGSWHIQLVLWQSK
jgi:hypothetical protein